MDIKNILKNITPSVTVMVVGLVGAYFVYNTYFSDRVASGVAGYEPAAGEEVVVTEGETAVDMTVTEEAAPAVEGEAAVEGEVTFTSAEEAAPAVEGEAIPATEGEDAAATTEEAAPAAEGEAVEQ